MEEKIRFIRGQHATEKVAYELAENIASVLRKTGHNIEVEDVDEEKTSLWHARQLLAGKKVKTIKLDNFVFKIY